jgi:hypothetical protein
MIGPALGRVRPSRERLVVIALAALVAACAGVGPQPPMPISEVVKLSKSDTASEQVIARMRSTRSVYAARGSDFGRLADLGVKPAVLDFIQVRFVNDVELLTRYYVLGESLGGCVYCFPQPLDLADLANGGNGMSPHLPTGNYTYGGRPPGIPTWIPASPALAFNGAPGITVDEIAKRATEGIPANELARQVCSSRLEGLIAQDTTSVTTMSTVGLHGSELAALHQQGVPDLVVDAIQEQYLAQFVEYQRLRYQLWGPRPFRPNVPGMPGRLGF